MTVHEMSRLIGDIMFVATIVLVLAIFARALWNSRGKKIRWVHDADDHSSVNSNGTPMINASFDAMGNVYGTTNTHH
jgi:hypothetical protein